MVGVEGEGLAQEPLVVEPCTLIVGVDPETVMCSV